MRGYFISCAAVAAAALLGFASFNQTTAQDRVAAGSLTCDVSAGFGVIIGSRKAVNCTFAPAQPGPVEYYSGTITKLGVDIGVTTPASSSGSFTPRPAGPSARCKAATSARLAKRRSVSVSAPTFLSGDPIKRWPCSRSRCKANGTPMSPAAWPDSACSSFVRFESRAAWCAAFLYPVTTRELGVERCGLT